MPCSTTNTPWLPSPRAAFDVALPPPPPPSPRLLPFPPENAGAPPDLARRLSGGSGRQMTSPAAVHTYRHHVVRGTDIRRCSRHTTIYMQSQHGCGFQLQEIYITAANHVIVPIPAVYMMSWPAASTRSNNVSGTLAKNGSPRRICRENAEAVSGLPNVQLQLWSWQRPPSLRLLVHRLKRAQHCRQQHSCYAAPES